jgi:hypothetical protein
MNRYLNITRLPGARNPSSPSTPIDVDDDLTDLPTSEADIQNLQETPPPNYEGSTFNINWNEIWHGTKRLIGCYYMPQHKRVVGTNAKVSWIWQHSAKLVHNSKKYWLCRLCHRAKKYSSALYSASSTEYCHEHMETFHGLVDPAQAAEREEKSRAQSTDPF